MGMIGNSLAQGLISGANIQDGTVDTPDIKDSAVTAAKIASAVITPAKLSTGAPTWDANSNVGVGVSLSSWDTTYKAIQVGARSMFFGIGSETNIANNVYYNAGNKYVANSGAGLYRIDANVHKWYQAGSGTAGDAISFTQTMTLQASGGFSLGTTNDPGAGNVNLANGKFIGWGNLDTLIYGDSSSNYIYFRTNAAEKARIDSSGNLLVGTTTASGLLSLVNAQSTAANNTTTGSIFSATSPTSGVFMRNRGNSVGIGGSAYSTQLFTDTGAGNFEIYNAAASYSLVFGTAATERARINSSGYFSFFSTNTSGSFSDATPRFYVGNSTDQYLWHTTNTTSANFYVHRTNTSGNFLYFGSSSSYVGQISTNGSSVSYTSASDYRLKENVVPLTGALARVALLKPCTFAWIGKETTGEGFIAHELAEVIPHAVVGDKDAEETYIDDDGEELTRPVYQSVDTSFMVATLTAAIQEQQAIIESLTERITALETP